MSKQTINIGASPNDGTGTPLRTSFDYTNQNFTELYTALGGGVGLPGATTQVIFNDGGTNLAGDAGLVYNKTTDALTVAGLVTAGSATITGDLTVDTSTLKVDSTNNRVGILTASPADTLDVNGRVTALRYLSSSSSASLPSFAVAAGNGIYNSGVNQVGFAINGANAMTLNASGNLAFPDAKGIDFSATPGTGTSELLNDYEEGAFTPTIVGTTIAGVGVYGDQNGRYTKVGRLVTCQIFVNWTAHTGTGDMRIGGLPFATTSTAGIYQAASIGWVNNIALTAGYVMTAYALDNSSTLITLQQYPTGGGASLSVPIDTLGGIIISVSYIV